MGVHRLSRRSILAFALAMPALHLARGADDAAAVDAIAAEPWFLHSPYDLAADITLADRHGKHLMLLWEHAGNPECAEIHSKILRDAAIADFVRKQFDVAQFDASGTHQVADLDGERLTETTLGEKYGVRFTPTIQFFSEKSIAAAMIPRQREIIRLQGFVEPAHALVIFHFVAEHAYETQTLRQYLRAHIG